MPGPLNAKTAEVWREPAERKRADAKADKILTMLAAAGSLSCTNSQLWTVCHAVNSRILDLIRRGHEIDGQSEGRGVWFASSGGR